MKQFYTYLHCKPNGDPFYVGKGKRSSGVCRSHDLKHDRNKHHQNIVAKHGQANILVYVFPCDSEAQAFAEEIRTIAQLRAEGYDLCNQTDGGEGISGWHHSAETKRQYSADRIGNKNAVGNKSALGLKRSPETCAKIGLCNEGRKRSPETCKKISIARYGTKQSVEVCLQKSINQSGKKRGKYKRHE